MTPNDIPTDHEDLAVRNRQYWSFQFAGWTAMALLSYLSLTIWYNPGEVAPAVHTVVQSILGVLVSHPLRIIGTRTWHTPLVQRVIIIGAAVIAGSLIWTALRIATFTLLTGEAIPASDWGGWIFASVMVFGAWSFCYHALKYYRISLTQRQLTIEAQNIALQAQTEVQEESFKRLEAETLFRDSQLRMLKYQLNPHFLLNALNSVSALVRRDDKQAAMKMLARIGDFLRTSLDDRDALLHTLGEELDALDAYLSIERVRFGDRLVTEFEVDASAINVTVPSLLLQPLFENAIKYAVGQRMTPTRIHFKAEATHKGVKMRITDDGPGITTSGEDLIEANSGVGLSNVKKRLESTYGDKFDLSISSNSPSGLTINILIEGEPLPSLLSS